MPNVAASRRSQGGYHPEMLAPSRPPEDEDCALLFAVEGPVMARDPAETVAGYLTDMLVLQERIARWLRAQVEVFARDHPEVTSQLGAVCGQVLRHIRELKALSESRLGGPGKVAGPVVERRAGLTGTGAAATNLRGNERLPGDLRDDFAAINLAGIGYAMLLTTARSLDDLAVADLAERHLRDCSDAVVRLRNVIPTAVVNLLEEDGLAVSPEVLPTVNRTLEQIWRIESGSLAHT
jgi:hypothetical protein